MLCRLVQLTTSRQNTQESLDGERITCDQYRASIAELAEEALTAKVKHPFSISRCHPTSASFGPTFP